LEILERLESGFGGGNSGKSELEIFGKSDILTPTWQPCPNKIFD